MSVKKPWVWSEAYQRISIHRNHSYSCIIYYHNVIIINHTKASFQLCQWGLKPYETSRRGWARRRSASQCTSQLRLVVRQISKERKPPSQRRPCKIWVHQDECNQNMLIYLRHLTIHNMNIWDVNIELEICSGILCTWDINIRMNVHITIGYNCVCIPYGKGWKERSCMSLCPCKVTESCFGSPRLERSAEPCP